MRCPALIAALFVLAPISPALTLAFDHPQYVVLNKTTPSTLTLTGNLDLGFVPRGNPTGLSLTFHATGQGKSFTAAQINASILTSIVGGKYSGALLYLSLPATTPLGLYSGTAQLKIQYGRTTYTSSPSDTPFSFQVVRTLPVPEPTAFAPLGFATLLLLRRRK